MAERKECFIIMPITTPDLMLKEYRDGAEHFKHVLDCLFIPAIEKAGYIPKSPFAQGSDLIHAEIINSLETADIVLCDMSCLNPNVFFEFGIRTSLNKPVCVVKDELTKIVPFDTGIINHQEYKSSIDPWHLDAEINKLSDHISSSYKRSNGKNTLWKKFGLKSEAAPYKAEAGGDGKIDYIALQLDSLEEKIDKIIFKNIASLDMDTSSDNFQRRLKIDWIANQCLKDVPSGLEVKSVTTRENSIVVVYTGDLTQKQKDLLSAKVKEIVGKDLIFQRAITPPK